MVTESSPGRRRIVAAAAIAALALLLTSCGNGSDESAATPSGSSSASASGGGDVLLDAQELTVLDQPIDYPRKKPAQVSSAIVSLEPGQETGWRKHKVPLYVYVLEGTLTVEYDAGVTKEFGPGTAHMEADDVWHNDTNKGDATARILTVYMGAKGARNVIERTS